jgi:hypothetical protein
MTLWSRGITRLVRLWQRASRAAQQVLRWVGEGSRTQVGEAYLSRQQFREFE